MLIEIEKSVSQLKSQDKSSEELSYDVIELFKKVLTSEEKNKSEILHYIYSELIESEINGWFKKTSIREFSQYPEFVDWYAEQINMAPGNSRLYKGYTFRIF